MFPLRITDQALKLPVEPKTRKPRSGSWMRRTFAGFREWRPLWGAGRMVGEGMIHKDVRTEGRERRDPAANLYAETCFTLMKITDEGGKPLARKPLRNRKCRADHSDGHSPLSCIRSGGGVTPPVLTHEKGGKGGKGGKCVGLCEPFLSCAHKKTFRLAAGARPAGRQDVGLRPSLAAAQPLEPTRGAQTVRCAVDRARTGLDPDWARSRADICSSDHPFCAGTSHFCNSC